MREIIKGLVPVKYRIGGSIIKIDEDRTVISGIFKGMKFTPAIIGSVPRPKLMGTYEKELSGVFETIIKSGKYKKVVDVGAAEGYYAVGLAINIPDIKVIAYETQPKGREIIKENATLNHVNDRVIVKGECTPEVLREELNDDTFVLVDVEGYEDKLLDPVACPELLKTDILVEIHDYISPEIAKNIKDRFLKTHDLTIIQSEFRTHLDFPIPLSGFQKLIFKLSGQDYKMQIRRAVHERSRIMRWFHMTRKK